MGSCCSVERWVCSGWLAVEDGAGAVGEGGEDGGGGV